MWELIIFNTDRIFCDEIARIFLLMRMWVVWFFGKIKIHKLEVNFAKADVKNQEYYIPNVLDKCVYILKSGSFAIDLWRTGKKNVSLFWKVGACFLKSGSLF